MAYDEDLANRIRELMADEPGVTEMRMFGGLAFLLGGHMSVAASGRGGLVGRGAPEEPGGLRGGAGAGRRDGPRGARGDRGAARRAGGAAVRDAGVGDGRLAAGRRRARRHA